MKTFTFHLDMIVVVILLFSMSIGANLYQNQQHGKLNKEYLAAKIELTNKHGALIATEIALKECNEGNASANIWPDSTQASSSG